MTRLHNDPARFADEAVEGFVAAHLRWVRAVPGGVVRRAGTPRGQVAVVVGGGSGHYPAFGGLVGDGLAAGAALGDVFASPSASRVVSVAQAAENGGGVLLAYGNYAGDVLNFTAAQDRLRAGGIACESVTVTDDISSAPAGECHRRRGVAGDLLVFKVAAAAAAQGRGLAEVRRLAGEANDRTRTLGVAFSGCTLPGSDGPLFTVPHGRMAVGLGIHGEPGLSETEIPSADGLAEFLVGRLLDELPGGVTSPAGSRVVAVLNGLGAVKYEELFVVYRSVHGLLEAAGLGVADSQVGEICTSFDMAGVSLSLLWLGDDLELLWAAPADTPAFHRAPAAGRAGGAANAAGGADAAEPEGAGPAPTAVGPVNRGPGDESNRLAGVAGRIFDAVEQAMSDHAGELGRIDAVAGDGDHGIGMSRGSAAAAAVARQASAAGTGVGTLVDLAGDAWADRAGGTSGALWGTVLRAIGARLGDGTRVTARDVAAAVSAACRAVLDTGGARVGDKTMVDALVPFDETLTAAVASGQTLPDAWLRAATAARTAADATRDLLPQRGRARLHAERSLGTPDAGAVSLALVVAAAAEVLARTGLPCAPGNHRDGLPGATEAGAL